MINLVVHSEDKNKKNDTIKKYPDFVYQEKRDLISFIYNKQNKTK